MAQEFVIKNGFISRDDSQLSGSLSVLESNVSMTGFASGFAGYGTKVDFQNNSVDTTDMSIRGRLSVYELLINQIRATNGSVWVSSTGKVETVGGVSSSFTPSQDEIGGLKRYYTFDDLSNRGRDYSGQNVSATINVNVSSSIITGSYGVTYSGSIFNPITLPDTNLNFGSSSAFTMMGRFTIHSKDSIAGSAHGLLMHNSFGTSYGISFNNDTNFITVGVRGTTLKSVASSAISLNRQYHVTLLYDSTSVGSEVKMYMDGTFVNSTSKDTVDFKNSSVTDYTILSRSPLGGNTPTNVNASADDVRIYDRALTPEEIARIYTGNTQTTYPSNGLVALYTFNDGSTSIARDYTGNGYTGSLVSGVMISASVVGNLANTSGSFTRQINSTIPSTVFTGDFSVSTWINSFGYLSNGSVANVLFGYGDNVNLGGRFGIFVATENTIQMWLNGVSVGAGATPLTIGEWTHITATVSPTAGQTRIYKNGSLIATHNASFALSGSLQFTIAGQSIDSTRHLNAQYESVQVYNRILSQEEVTALFNNRGGIALNTGEDTNHGFLVGDLIRAQRFSGHGVYQSNGVVSHVQNLQTFRFEPINLVNPTLELPREGYEYVRIGNIYDTTRQGAVYLTADDSGAPFMDVIDGIDSFSKFNTAGTVKTRTGNLTGITSPVFGALTNQYGFYASGSAYLEGSINATAGKIANLTITADKVYQGTGTFGNDNTKLFLSSSGDFSLGEKFRWNASAGTLNIDGVLTASAGNIGGFNIGATTLTATNFTLDTAGKRLSLGTSDTIVVIDADEGMWVGHATKNSAPFSVGLNGALTASAGTIANFFINGSNFWTGNSDIGSTSTNLVISSALGGKIALAPVGTASNAITLTSTTGILLSGSGEFNLSRDSSNYIRGVGNSLDIRAGTFNLSVGNTLNINSATGGLITLGGTDASYANSNVAFSGSGIGKFGSINIDGNTGGRIFTGTGTFNNSDTPLFLSGSGVFSLGNKLSWNGTTLTIDGAITANSGAIANFFIDTNNLWAGNATLGSTSTNIVISSALGGKIAMAPVGTASNTITLTSNTGILLSASGEFNFSRNADNYIRGSGASIDIKATVFNLSASSTLILESTTPKFALGASANAQSLTVGTGVFLNGSGHFKAGNATAQRIVFDGTNILISASNAVITGSSGWLGASDMIQWSGTTVRVAGFYLDGNHLWGGNATLGNAGTTVVLDSTVQKFAMSSSADSITKTSNAGIFLSGSGEFNFAYDANNYIRRDGTTFSIRATNAIISGSSVNIGAESFNLKAGNLYIVGNGASSYIRLGSLTSTDPNTTNTGSYFDNAGSFLFKAGTTANTNYIRFNAGVMTIDSTAFLLKGASTLYIDTNKIAVSPSNASNLSVSNTLEGTVLENNGNFLSYGSPTNYIRRSGTTLDIKAGTFDLVVGNTLNITSTVGGLISLGGTDTTYANSNVAFSGSGIGKFGNINIVGNTGGSIFTGTNGLTSISAGFFMSGSGEFNLVYDANNYIRRDGTTFTIRATNAIISGSSVNIGAEAFNLKAGNLFLVGNGASSYVRLGSLTSTDPNTTNTGSYMDNNGSILFKAGTTVNTNFLRFTAGAMTINSTAFDLVVGNTLNVSSATGGLITLGGTDVSYANSNVAFSGSGIGKFGVININGNLGGSILTGTSTLTSTTTGFFMSGSGEFNFARSATNYIRGSGASLDIKAGTFDLVVGNTLNVTSTVGGLITLGGTGTTYALSNVALSGSGIGKFGSINIDGNTGGRIFTGTGTFNNSDTPLFLSGSGAFSLGNKMSWNGTSLSIDGAITASAGNIAGWVVDANKFSKTDSNKTIELNSNDKTFKILSGSVPVIKIGDFQMGSYIGTPSSSVSYSQIGSGFSNSSFINTTTYMSISNGVMTSNRTTNQNISTVTRTFTLTKKTWIKYSFNYTIFGFTPDSATNVACRFNVSHPLGVYENTSRSSTDETDITNTVSSNGFRLFDAGTYSIIITLFAPTNLVINDIHRGAEINNLHFEEQPVGANIFEANTEAVRIYNSNGLNKFELNSDDFSLSVPAINIGNWRMEQINSGDKLNLRLSFWNGTSYVTVQTFIQP